MKNSERIKNRLFQCVDEGDLTLGDILHIIENLANKVNLVSQATYSKKLGLSRAGMKKRVDTNKEASCMVGGRKFIVD
jgi:hypothetical protein